MRQQDSVSLSYALSVTWVVKMSRGPPSQPGLIGVYSYTRKLRGYTYRHTLRPGATPVLVCDGSGEEGELLA